MHLGMWLAECARPGRSKLASLRAIWFAGLSASSDVAAPEDGRTLAKRVLRLGTFRSAAQTNEVCEVALTECG